ncbi:hypothetical protein [Streptomyces sp. H27-D2]|uniref:hypothetical protein n=1 Tax=Streptomyces sp. H27-D2 TaxID=3046304 RepID=UPI002DBC259C|nr:hypothetical protein [Streptomyces sp. H27-D2]MEC4015052.1 hypothetical protein [Streptomyces sp. H27-D2]
MSAVKEVRRLSDIEATFAYRHALMHGDTQVTTHVTLDAAFGPEQVERAVRLWARRFPLLSLRIGEAGGSLWFRQSGPPCPGQLAQCELPGARTPADLLADEVNDVLPGGGRLWRLRVAHDRMAGVTHVYFTRHHALSDGYAEGRLVRALLDLLFGRPGVDGVPSAVEDLAPNADELTYRPPRRDPPVWPGTASRPGTEHEQGMEHGQRTEHEQGTERGQGAEHCPGARWPLERTGPGASAGESGQPAGQRGADRPWRARGTGVVSLSLPPRESLRLKRWCGERQVTISQFLAAALAESYARTTGRDEVVLSSTVSLRQRYAEHVLVPEAGCFLNVVPTPLRIGVGGPVGHARAYARSLRAADAAWRPGCREHSRIRRAVEAEAAGEGAAGISVTDAGSVDVALGAHAARVTDVRTVVNRKAAAAPAVNALHLSAFKGALGLSLTYPTPGADAGAARATVMELGRRALNPGTP